MNMSSIMLQFTDFYNNLNLLQLWGLEKKQKNYYQPWRMINLMNICHAYIVILEKS